MGLTYEAEQRMAESMRKEGEKRDFEETIRRIIREEMGLAPKTREEVVSRKQGEIMQDARKITNKYLLEMIKGDME